MSAPGLTPPALITSDHDLADFDSGESSLDDWLRRRALRNRLTGASRCFVVCIAASVVGYYSLSAGAIGHEAAPKAMRRNMPDPLPVLLLGRLAVDRRYHNRGIGQALLRDAMRRAAHVAVGDWRIRHFGSRHFRSGQAILPLAWLRGIGITADDFAYDPSNRAVDSGRARLRDAKRQTRDAA